MKKIESYTAAAHSGTLLNANELSLNLSSEIIREIQDAIPSIAFNRYPDTTEQELLDAYSKVIHIPSDQLLAGNGSDQMLGYMIGTYLGHGKKLMTLNPDFSMYDYYASTYETEVVKFKENEDGSYDLNAFIEAAEKEKPDMILFSNPNNPGGQCLSPEEIRTLAETFPDIPVVSDEAYIEFSDVPSSIALVDRYPNLFITRTLSKAYGLAGLRVGFLCSAKANMKQLKENFVPYGLNAVSMKIASIVLKHAEEFEPVIAEIKQERKRMYDYALTLNHVTLYPSQGNFLHGRVRNKQLLLDLFAKEDIVIRNYADPETFRISIGTKEENDRVKEVLRQYDAEAEE